MDPTHNGIGLSPNEASARTRRIARRRWYGYTATPASRCMYSPAWRRRRSSFRGRHRQATGADPALVRRLLRMLHVEARIHGMPAEGLPGNVLIVANHISWLDIFVLNTLQPARFVAKAELKRWPLVGSLIGGCGTLFIERERRRDACASTSARRGARGGRHDRDLSGRDDDRRHDAAAVPRLAAAADRRRARPRAAGGDPLSPARRRVQRCARLRRRDHVLGSFWRVLGQRNLVVEMRLPPALAARDRHRRELSRAAETAIRTALALPARGPAPETPGDRRA